MLRISLPYVYELAERLEALRSLEKITNEGYAQYFAISAAELSVKGLIQNSVFAQTLRSCQQSGSALLEVLSPLVPGLVAPDSKLEMFEIFTIKARLSDFKIALLAEMGILPSYFVTQKGAFDTSALLDRPNSLFTSELVLKVPETTFDVAEAAKALAYELGTAAGFHLFRVVESVIRRYYNEITGGKAHPKVRSIKTYIRAMEAANAGDPAVLRALEQLADFHRNPLIHPEAALSSDEAISVLGMARSVTTAMLNRLPTPPQTTSSSSSLAALA